ncbi:hypothetical protein GUITHDRAFT_115212 [Guillardia theta CCMP2712]|uniref:protein phosphatase methylesterase-1 n=1 Tax=Guillardia theta (strain CCMP2712) TaxID=905079 RepID=L1IS63_GUITC|nr:hypothetical protein GUITHDRAFT_115212 [Guillardia theta CCMP2712]EKX38665.1 hypothetical protein GUITHDRAFT_115212 [Guillardia theta CCMP2712]|eukprot:XP_005825645.1 hypothetical protein GUITHDRAFT_115212 [Guillardia theta CCMP2712]
MQGGDAMEEEEAQGDLRRPGRRREEGDQNESPHVFDYMHEVALVVRSCFGLVTWNFCRSRPEKGGLPPMLLGSKARALHAPWGWSVIMELEPTGQGAPSEMSCPVVLVGHSLGGAIAVEIAQKELIHNLKAIVIIETSEGLVKDSMSRARQFLDRRPTRFGSVDEAVNWAIDSEIYKSREAAESSVPRMLVEDGDGWVWKTNLSEKLEDASKWKCHKLVIVCAKESLDCNLMEFEQHSIMEKLTEINQAEIIPGGHMIHEERPKDVAKLIINFLSRWKLLTPVQGKPTSP